jgi:hypothetical protein
MPWNSSPKDESTTSVCPDNHVFEGFLERQEALAKLREEARKPPDPKEIRYSTRTSIKLQEKLKDCPRRPRPLPEDEECTFEPDMSATRNVRPPKGFSVMHVEAYNQHRLAYRESRQIEVNREELVGCTFAPEIRNRRQRDSLAEKAATREHSARSRTVGPTREEQEEIQRRKWERAQERRVQKESKRKKRTFKIPFEREKYEAQDRYGRVIPRK